MCFLNHQLSASFEYKNMSLRSLTPPPPSYKYFNSFIAEIDLRRLYDVRFSRIYRQSRTVTVEDCGEINHVLLKFKFHTRSSSVERGCCYGNSISPRSADHVDYTHACAQPVSASDHGSFQNTVNGLFFSISQISCALSFRLYHLTHY